VYDRPTVINGSLSTVDGVELIVSSQVVIQGDLHLNEVSNLVLSPNSTAIIEGIETLKMSATLREAHQ